MELEDDAIADLLTKAARKESTFLLMPKLLNESNNARRWMT